MTGNPPSAGSLAEAWRLLYLSDEDVKIPFKRDVSTQRLHKCIACLAGLHHEQVRGERENIQNNFVRANGC